MLTNPIFSDEYTLNEQFNHILLLLLPLALASSISATDAITILLIFSWGYSWIFEGREVFKSRELVYACFLYLALVFLPTFPVFSAETLSELFLHQFRKLFFLLIVVDLILNREECKTILLIWVVVCGMNGLFTSIVYFGQLESFYYIMSDTNVLHAGGWAGWHHIQFGDIMSYTLPFACFYSFYSVKKGFPRRGMLFALVACFIVAGVFVSNSRMAWASLTLVPAICFLNRDTRKLSFVLIMFLLATLGIYLILSPDAYANFSSIQGVFRSGRFKFWTDVITHYEEFLWGAGPGRAAEIVKMSSIGLGVMRLGHAHNTLVHLFIEYGVFGIGAYFIFWFYVLRGILNNASFFSRDKFILWGTVGLVLLFHAQSLTEHTWGRSMIQYNLMFGLAIFFGYAEYDQETTNQ